MINYFFVLDINSNGILIDKPKSSKPKYKNVTRVLVDKVKPALLARSERGKKSLGGEQVFYQKINDKIMLFAIGHDIKHEGHVFRLFTDFYREMERSTKPLKGNRELETWLKDNINKVNKGARMTAAERINKKVEDINNKISERLNKEIQKLDNLQELDDDVIKIEDEAKQMRTTAVELHQEAWIYNRKLEIMVWGAVGLLVVIIGIWLLQIVS